MSETYYSDDEREAEIRDGLNRARSTLFARGDVYNFLGSDACSPNASHGPLSDRHPDYLTTADLTTGNASRLNKAFINRIRYLGIRYGVAPPSHIPSERIKRRQSLRR